MQHCALVVMKHSHTSGCGGHNVHVKGWDYGFSIPQDAQNATGQDPEQSDSVFGLTLPWPDDSTSRCPFPPKPCCHSTAALPELPGNVSWTILGSILAAQQFYNDFTYKQKDKLPTVLVKTCRNNSFWPVTKTPITCSVLEKFNIKVPSIILEAKANQSS